MSESIWSDEPPTEAGWYWVRSRFGPDYIESISYWTPSTNARFVQSVLAYNQFGPRVPDAKRCAEIERGSDERH